MQAHRAIFQRALQFGALLLLLLATNGCYWHWSNALGDPFPVPAAAEPLPLTVGLVMSGLSNAPQAPSIPPSAVVQEFAERMTEERMFATVVYPLTPLAHVQPDVVFDLTVRIEEHHHWAENIVKAIFTGATFLLLGPVLPTHYTVVVDLMAASSSGAEQIDSYHYRSEYDYYYTTMTPSGTKMEEWLTTARNHAVEDVLGQIKQDRHRYAAIAHREPELPPPAP